MAPLPPNEWPKAMGDALAALFPPEPLHPFPERSDDRPKGLHVLGMFAHHPALARAYNTFNGHILFATTLTMRQRELLVLRVASVRSCEYEWAQHAILAGDADITGEELDRVVAGPEAPGWTPLEAAMLRAVDELIAGAKVADATWAALAAELDPKQLLDLVFTIGAYDLLAMAMRSCGLQLDADLRRD